MTSSKSNQVKSLIAGGGGEVEGGLRRRQKTCIMAQTRQTFTEERLFDAQNKQGCMDIIEHELQTLTHMWLDLLNDLQLKDF